MSLSTTFANDLGKLIFQAVAIANLADNAATGPLTNLYVGLHFSPGPGAAGTQATNELTDANYARVAVPRTSGGFSATTNTVTNVAAVLFAAFAGGSGQTATHFTIGTAASGAGKVLARGALGATLDTNPVGTTPNFLAGQLVGTFVTS